MRRPRLWARAMVEATSAAAGALPAIGKMKERSSLNSSMGEPQTRHHRKNPGIPLRSSTRITGGDLIGTLLRRLILNNGHRRLIVDRPARTVRRAFAGLALLSSLVACGTTSAKPSPLGTPQSSTNAVTTPT